MLFRSCSMILLMACTASEPTSSQYIGSVTFLEDAEIRSFCGGRTELSIDGDLQIGQAITDLSGLFCLRDVSGYLHIEATALQNLHGLEGLQHIGEYLYLGYNRDLEDLSGLGGLTEIDGSADIKGHLRLQNLSGLSLLRVGRSLDIRGNMGMTSLEGLESLKIVGMDLRIEYNDDLVDVSALSALPVVGRDFFVMGSPDLVDLSGMQLERIGGDFSLSRSGLVDLEGMEELRLVSGNFFVIDNPFLERLDAAHPEKIRKNVRILGNPRLEGVDAWLQGVEVGGTTEISP